MPKVACFYYIKLLRPSLGLVKPHGNFQVSAALSKKVLIFLLNLCGENEQEAC